MSGPHDDAADLRVARRSALLAACVTAAVLVAGDLQGVVRGPPALDAPGGAALFAVVAWALGSTLLGVVCLARFELLRALERRGPTGSLLGAAVDAGALFVLSVVLPNPHFLDADLRAAVLGVGIVGLASIRAFADQLAPERRARAARATSVALIALSFVLLWQLPARGSPWLHLALHLVVASSLGRLLIGRRAAPSKRWLLALGAVAGLLLLGAGPLLARSPSARLALHHRAPNARAWVAVPEALIASDDHQAQWLGGAACEGCGRRDRAPKARARRTAPTSASAKGFGAAAGSDVLILSIDALRWDRVGDLQPLIDVLGPHARFETAVSPAPGTRESLAATGRGRAVRGLRFEGAPATRGRILWRDTSPTLAHRLLAAGYRALTVPTSNVADPRIGVLPGFDSVWVANFDASARLPRRSPFTQRYVSTEESIPVVLRAAREAPNPLCVWLHAMEPHAPYHLRDERAGAALTPFQRYMRSLRETAEQLAGFVRAFSAARGGKRPLVAVFGDHGEEFGEHGGAYHATSVHAEQVRVGFLLAGPGVPVGRFDAPVSTSALPATLLDLLGLDTPASMTEASLLPALMGEAAFPTLAVSEVRVGGSRMIGYTHARYRYLHDPVYGVEMLFDSKADPYEQRDLSARQPEALAMLRELARAWDDAH